MATLTPGVRVATVVWSPSIGGWVPRKESCEVGELTFNKQAKGDRR